MSWVLILTLVGNRGAYGVTTPAIATISDFRSQSECVAAGSAWLKQAGRLSVDSARAICVQRSVK